MNIAFSLLRFLFFVYLASCLFLYFYQRKLLYVPPAQMLDAAPAGSIYQTMKIEVQGVGKITNWIALPRDADSPVIVFFHGNGSDRTDFMQTGERLHRYGWGVVLASYPGYSGNPGDPSEDTLMAGARATIDALGHPPGGILLWGHSLGSGVAARMASEGRGQGLILEAPYTVISDIAASAFPIFPVRVLMRDRYDTRSLVPAIKVPVYIIHADGDPVIPFAMGRELAGDFGTQAEFHPLHLASHYPHAERDWSEAVKDWWRRKIKPAPRFASATPSAQGVAGAS
ncbi:MAG TPA: alpha/beta fold hydrolase [Burkholderiaceae bacterium]